MATFLGVLFLIVCILLIIVVLLQKGRGGGLGGAFGGGGGSTSAFGTRTGDVFTWVTIILTALFLLLSIFTTLAYRPDTGQVDAPYITVDNKTIRTSRDVEITEKVEIRTIDSTTTRATIRYSLIDPEVTEKSTPYPKSSIPVRPGQTLRVRAYRSGLEPSELLTVRFVYPAMPAPTFDPPAGPIDKDQLVTILCEDEKARIGYTIDGAEPTETSDVYSQPLVIKAGQVLRARAFPTEANHRPSTTTVGEYPRSLTPPPVESPEFPESKPLEVLTP